MLQTLKQTASCETLAEGIPIEKLSVRRRTETELVLIVSFNLSKLVNKVWIVGMESSQGGEGVGCFLIFADFDEIAGRFREEDEAGA